MLLPEVAAYLIAQGIGTALDTDVFLGKIPADPDVVVVLSEYTGMADEPDLGTGNIRLEFPRIQVLCRGAKDDYATPRQTAQTAKQKLMKVLNQTLSGVRYLAINVESGPFFLRRDQNDRIEIVANYQVTKEFSAT